MKIKSSILCLLTIAFVCFSLYFTLGAYTPSPIVETTYNTLGTSYIDGNIHQTNSIILRINTPTEATCVYWNSFIPITAFVGEYGLTHEAHLTGLDEGFHEYNISCGANPPMEIGFATNIPIHATVEISETPPLKEGQYKITLVTSEDCLEEPLLQYTFDESSYRQISLKGSGKNWEGYLIIPASAGETVGSFAFKAMDLAGRQGTEIAGDNIFIVDTVKPATIEVINAIGYQGQIKLDWFYEEKVNEFNIYKSESSNIEYTDFYKTTSNDYFTDNEVEKGKTYYYKVAGVDEAGNIGDLSKEIYATALLTNYSKTSGLSPMLIGKVDNSISEINSVIQDINEINSILDLKDDKEKNIFVDIKLDKEGDGAISELNALKRDVENYKLQDLTEGELDKKIAAATLKLNIIKKKVPEDITIIGEKESQRDLSEANIQKAFLEYSSDTGYDYKKEISATLQMIEDNQIKITSNFYDLEIMYLDGTKKDITLIEDSISTNTNDIKNSSIILVVPKEIAEKSSELKIVNIDYNIIKDDPVISFDSNTKKIIYYLNKQTSLESLEGILITPIKLPESTSTDLRITGNSILSYASNGSWGIIILVVFALVLVVYFLKIRSEPSIRPVLTVIEDIKKSKDLLKNGKEVEAKELYERVKEEYKLLSEKEKNLVMKSIKEMNGEF